MSVEEYLSTSYRPDREYVDGRAYDFTADGMREPEGGLLKVTSSDIAVPMEEIFRQVAPR